MPNYVTLLCARCNLSFQRTTKDVASFRIKKRKTAYCSQTCKTIAESNKVSVICARCRAQFLKRPSQVNDGNNFCSKSCAATYNNTHKITGTRRSKLEIYLEEQIRATYPNLKLLCNDKTAINSELDFYFPDLQLAIELNGIVHFEPIYGESKLAQIQTNDNKKAFLCCQKQINLAIVDTSQCSYLNHTAKNKYATIVNNLIQSMLL